MADKYTLAVYLDNGRVFEWDVATPGDARAHADAVGKNGYYHNAGKGVFEMYPVHRIVKVKVTGGIIDTAYPDRERGI